MQIYSSSMSSLYRIITDSVQCIAAERTLTGVQEQKECYLAYRKDIIRYTGPERMLSGEIVYSTYLS